MRKSICCLFLVTSCSTASVSIKRDFDFSSVNRVSVAGFSDYPRRPGSGEILKGAFEQALISAGYELVERSKADAVLQGRITDFREPRERQTQVEVVDERQDPIYVHRTRETRGGLLGGKTQTQEDVLTGYQTTRVVRHEPRTVTVDGALGVSARLTHAGDGVVLWSGSDVVRAYAFEDAARQVAGSILEAVKPTWPSSRPKR